VQRTELHGVPPRVVLELGALVCAEQQR
jgi:hypothetical protein